MKRLKKKAFGKTIWHGTSLDKFKSIVENGALFPNEEEGAGPGGADISLFDGFTFFATEFSVAKGYALNIAEAGDSPGIIIEIDISEDALLPDDNDDPHAKTWQESADFVDQVKVSGPIYTNFFQTIYFYDIDFRIVGNVPFGQWESFYEENKDTILYGKHADDVEMEEEYFEDGDLDFESEDYGDFEDLDFDIDDYEEDEVPTDNKEDEEAEPFDWETALDNLLDDEEHQTAKVKIKRLIKNNLPRQ